MIDDYQAGGRLDGDISAMARRHASVLGAILSSAAKARALKLTPKLPAPAHQQFYGVASRATREMILTRRACARRPCHWPPEATLASQDISAEARCACSA